MRLEPKDPKIYLNRGVAYARTGRLDEAIIAFSAAIQAQPDLAAAHHNLGDVLKDQGRFDEAMSCYERALTVAPDYPASRWHQTMLSLLTAALLTAGVRRLSVRLD